MGACDGAPRAANRPPQIVGRADAIGGENLLTSLRALVILHNAQRFVERRRQASRHSGTRGGSASERSWTVRAVGVRPQSGGVLSRCWGRCWLEWAHGPLARASLSRKFLPPVACRFEASLFLSLLFSSCLAGALTRTRAQVAAVRMKALSFFLVSRSFRRGTP